MKFAYFTTLICGIVCLGGDAMAAHIILLDKDNSQIVGGMFLIVVFSLMGLSLLISAFQIRKKIRYDELAAQINAI